MKINIITTIPIFFFIIIILSLSSASRPLPPPLPTTEFIKSKCNLTEFPLLCISSLSSYASSIGDSPLQLAHAALNITLASARHTSAAIASLSPSRMSPREAEAVGDCAEILADSVDSLRRSMKRMGGFEGREFGERIDDVQTWVSAALTDDSTCMDGFGGEGMSGEVRKMVVGRVGMVAHLTANALSLINDLAPLH